MGIPGTSPTAQFSSSCFGREHPCREQDLQQTRPRSIMLVSQGVIISLGCAVFQIPLWWVGAWVFKFPLQLQTQIRGVRIERWLEVPCGTLHVDFNYCFVFTGAGFLTFVVALQVYWLIPTLKMQHLIWTICRNCYNCLGTTSAATYAIGAGPTKTATCAVLQI